MKLQQLRYLVAIVDNGMNITAAAQALFTSQPGVSKQVRLLEDELSLNLFVRKGKSLAGLTEAGHRVVKRARRILSEVANIKSLSGEMSGKHQGRLVVATTHTQARYVLPDLLQGFHLGHPDIAINLHQGRSDQISQQVQQQEADFAIASGRSELFDELVTFPIYQWDRVLIVPEGHELEGRTDVSLAELSAWPIISYTHSFDEGSDQAEAFRAAGVEPNVVFTAEDPDVIKNYVRRGMGIGIVASMAFDEQQDSGLKKIPSDSLFPRCTTWIGFHRDRFLPEYMQAFLELMIPDSSREEIRETILEATGGRVLWPAAQTAVPLNRSGSCRPHSRTSPKNRVSCSSIPVASGRLV